MTKRSEAGMVATHVNAVAGIQQRVLSPEILGAITYLTTLGSSRKLDGHAMAAITLIASSNASLSAELFHSKMGGFANGDVVVALVKASNFGRLITSALRKVGLFSFLKDVALRETSERMLYRVIATACFAGPTDPGTATSLTAQHMISVLDWYRTDDGLRFRPEVWGTQESGLQCVREVARACHRLFNDSQFLERSVNTRITYGKSRTLEDIKRNSAQREKETLVLVEKFRSQERLAKNWEKQLAMDVLNWLSANCGNASLKQVFLGEITPNKTFSEFLYDRRGKITDHLLNQIRYAVKFSKFSREYFQVRHAARSLRDVISEEEYEWALNKRGKRSSGKRSESSSTPLPSFLFTIALEILEAGEAGWLGQCGYFNEKVLMEGEMRTVYCPVLPTLFLALMYLPIRQSQMKRLDSGEGDLKCFDGDSLTWNENDGPLAGYWQQKAGEKRADKVEHRGYAKLYNNVTPTITGFNITTNKSGEPYDIPWQHAELHRALWNLVKWQKDHNPVNEPTSPARYVDDEDRLTPEALARMPNAFLLFRMPASSKSKRYNQPPSSSQVSKAWAMLMSEVERLWNSQNPEHRAYFVSYDRGTKQPLSCEYNLHGLRARGLTELHEKNVPIEVISKVVAGHASVVMTIYYLLFHPSRINDLLEKSRVESRLSQQEAYARDLKALSVDQAKRKSAYYEDEAVEAAVNISNKLPCSNVGIGICPFSGTRCGDGRLLNKQVGSSSEKKYGPPEGGERNCIMCRHLISGPAWREDLILYGRLLFLKREDAIRRRNQFTGQIDDLIRLKRLGEIAAETHHTTTIVLSHKRDIISDEITILDRASFNVLRLLQACALIAEEIKEEDDPTPVLIASDPTSMEEYISRMEETNALALAARWYPLLHDEMVENASIKYLDLVFHSVGELPLSLREDISEAERKRGYDQARSLLASNLSRQEMTAISEGKIRISDVGLHKQAQKLVNDSVKAALELRNLPSRTRELCSGANA